MDKEILQKIIKDWVTIDDEIRNETKQLALKKASKKQKSLELIELMKTHTIDCFSIANGDIVYTKKNVKKPITGKLLMTTLSAYFDGDVDKATEIHEYIHNNREVQSKENVFLKKTH